MKFSDKLKNAINGLKEFSNISLSKRNSLNKELNSVRAKIKYHLTEAVAAINEQDDLVQKILEVEMSEEDKSLITNLNEFIKSLKSSK